MSTILSHKYNTVLNNNLETLCFKLLTKMNNVVFIRRTHTASLLMPITLALCQSVKPARMETVVFLKDYLHRKTVRQVSQINAYNSNKVPYKTTINGDYFNLVVPPLLI